MKKLKKNLKKSCGNQDKQGFTLVELIIVIAIIAVLAVSAFMMLTKWLGQSRDSRRIADGNTIKNALTIHMSDLDNSAGLLPVHDGLVELSISGTTIGYQGNFDSDLIKQMDNLQKVPTDPDGDYYTYYVSADRKKFQVLVFLERENKLVGGNVGNWVKADNSSRYETSFGYDLGVFTNTNKVPVQNLGLTGIELTTTLDNFNIAYKDDILEDVNGTEALSSIIIVQDKEEFVDLDDSLVAYWDMETTTDDGKLKDLSKYANHGTAYGGVAVGDVDGKKGKGSNFDGVDDYFRIEADNSLDLTSSEFTISTSFYMDSTIRAFIVEGFGGIPLIQTSGEGAFGMTFGRNNEDTERVYYANSLTTLESGWNNITVTYNRSTIDFYLNGEYRGKVDRDYDMVGTPPTYRRIGGRSTVWVDGIIDEIRIYKRALTDVEVKALYNIN